MTNTKYNDYILDIETRPLKAKAAEMFRPNKVKLGNLKDPEKIKEKIEAARVDFEELAALSPHTGGICAIGIQSPSGATRIFTDLPKGTEGLDKGEVACGCEGQLLIEFWEVFRTRMRDSADSWLTWSGNGHWKRNFDSEFIFFRSWVHRMTIPYSWQVFSKRVKSVSQAFLFEDTQSYCSLGQAAKALDLENGKGAGDEVTGADFYKFLDAGGDDRKKAMNYLRNDLVLTREISEVIK